MQPADTDNSTPFAAFLAIDWGDQKHAWARQSAGSSVRERGVIEHRPESIDAWIQEYLARFPGQPIAVCTEQKRGPLLYILMKYEQLRLFPVHPASSGRFRAALYPSGAKDDPKDAELLLDLLLHHRDRLRQWIPDTVETRKLQILVEARRAWVDERTRQGNRLRDQLKQYYPQPLDWFDNIQSEMAGAFLKRWPTLEAAQKARSATLRDFFHQHNSRSEECIERRLEQIRTAVVATKDRAIVETGALLVPALVDLIVSLNASIEKLEAEIEATMEQHPDADLFQALPGAGAALAPRLVAAFGTDRERFQTASELQSFSGIAPVQERSGKSDWIHFRHACPKFLRQTLHEWAGHTVGYSIWARAYYDQQRAKGNAHHAAVRALAFKWTRVIFRCWQDRTPYDEAKYLEALQRRGSPLAAAIAGLQASE